MMRIEEPPPRARASARRRGSRLGSALLLATALVGVSPSGIAWANGLDGADPGPSKCGKGHHDPCKGEQGPPGPPGPPGPCVAIDSTNRGSQQYTGVIAPDGDITVGTRSLQPNPGAYTWSPLSDNQSAPQNACDVTVTVQGNTLNVQVITTAGTVVETFCNVPGNQLQCPAPWTPVTPQPPA
ncbi:hypothetical protein [Streptomyces glaucescens]